MGNGFRGAPAITHSIATELRFYLRVFRLPDGDAAD